MCNDFRERDSIRRDGSLSTQFTSPQGHRVIMIKSKFALPSGIQGQGRLRYAIDAHAERRTSSPRNHYQVQQIHARQSQRRQFGHDITAATCQLAVARSSLPHTTDF